MLCYCIHTYGSMLVIISHEENKILKLFIKKLYISVPQLQICVFYMTSMTKLNDVVANAQQTTQQ